MVICLHLVTVPCYYIILYFIVVVLVTVRYYTIPNCSYSISSNYIFRQSAHITYALYHIKKYCNVGQIYHDFTDFIKIMSTVKQNLHRQLFTAAKASHR